MPASRLDEWRAYFALKREAEDDAIARAQAGHPARAGHRGTTFGAP